MIELAWHDGLDAGRKADVEEMLASAVEYDAEAGFSTARPSASSAGTVHHLVVTIAPPGERGGGALDDLPDVPLVAYLRLDVVEGVGHAQLVVRPEFRSHGVATLMTELLAEPGGWSAVPGLREVRVWSHGGHPAADRTARRFGARVEHGIFKTLRLVGGSRPFEGAPAASDTGDAEGPPPVLVPGHDEAMAPRELAILGSASQRLVVDGYDDGVRIGGLADEPTAGALAVEDPGVPRDMLHRLLEQALLELQSRGVRAVQLFVDALAEDFVGVSRQLGFEHDQTDYLYVLTP